MYPVQSKHRPASSLHDKNKQELVDWRGRMGQQVENFGADLTGLQASSCGWVGRWVGGETGGLHRPASEHCGRAVSKRWG